MSLDGAGNGADEPADHSRPVPPPADRAPDSSPAFRPAEFSGVAGAADELPPRQEVIEAQWAPRDTGDSTNAAWNRDNATPGTAPAADTVTLEPGAEIQERHPDDSHAVHAADEPSAVEPSAVEEALLKRIDELETDKASLDQRLSSQDRTIAGQSERIERLEAYVGEITSAVRELRHEQGKGQPSAGTTELGGDGQAEGIERQETGPRPNRRLFPSDAVTNVISVAAGGGFTELALHIRGLPPDVPGVGATGLALGAGMIAVLRERRKAKEDAKHRPEDDAHTRPGEWRADQGNARPLHPG